MFKLDTFKNFLLNDKLYPYIIIGCIILIFILPRIKKTIEGYENSGMSLSISNLYGDKESYLSSFIKSVDKDTIKFSKNIDAPKINAKSLTASKINVSDIKNTSNIDTTNADIENLVAKKIQVDTIKFTNELGRVDNLRYLNTLKLSSKIGGYFMDKNGPLSILLEGEHELSDSSSATSGSTIFKNLGFDDDMKHVFLLKGWKLETYANPNLDKKTGIFENITEDVKKFGVALGASSYKLSWVGYDIPKEADIADIKDISKIGTIEIDKIPNRPKNRLKFP